MTSRKEKLDGTEGCPTKTRTIPTMTHGGEVNKKNQAQDEDEEVGGGRVLKIKIKRQTKGGSETQSENCNKEKSYE